MSLESFYGGRQGISPVIKASFQFIDVNDEAYRTAVAAKTPAGGTISSQDQAAINAKTMDLCFANADYKDVWYDELCIIDTTNKNNPNNGKLFRRTLKSAGDSGQNKCAEYIGRIVGPAGTNPFFSFGSLNSVNQQGTIDKISLSPEMQVSYPIDTNGNISSAKTTINEGVEEQINIVPTVQSASLGDILVPGKASDGTYNDRIRYTWLNVVDDTREIPTRSIVYMGFEIPYPVLEIGSTTVNWQNSASIVKNEIEGEEGEVVNHPFYHNWTVSIPRGVRGNAATNIRLTTWNDFNIGTTETLNKPTLYNFNDFESNSTGVYTIKENPVGPPYPWENEDQKAALQNSYIWVYDYTFYDTDAYDDDQTDSREYSKTYSFYLGSYKEISNVLFEDDGTLTFVYSDTTTQNFPEKISWVDNVSIDNNGVLNFIFNQIKYRPTGDLQPQQDKTYYTYDNTTQQYNATPVEDEFASDIVYYEHTNVYSRQLPYPSSANVEDDGTILFNFVNGDSIKFKDVNTSEDFVLDYVKAINMNDDTKVLSYTTTVNNFTSSLNNNKGVNYIEAITIDEKYHLLVYYASTQYRITQTDITNGWKVRPGTSTTNIENRIPIVINGNYATWDNKTFRKGIQNYDNIYWQDFGSVREQIAGVKVRTEVNYDTYFDKESIDAGDWTPDEFIGAVLNPEFWTDDSEEPPVVTENPYYNGNIPGQDEQGNSLRGTFVFVPTVNNGTLFFYDYDAETWVYAGSLTDSNQTDAQILLNDNTPFNAQTLATYGVALVERTTASSSSLLPNFGV